MFKFIKKRKDYKRVDEVIDSCETIHQLNMAMNMTHNFGKVYGYEYYWRQLDKKGWELYMNHLDNIEYKERLEEVNEQEVSADAEGQSV